MARTRTAAPKVRPPKTFQHDPSTPEPCQAAQIALIVMKTVGAGKWSHVTDKAATEDIRALVNLAPTQQSLLDRYQDLLPYLRARPVVTVIACAECGMYGMSSGGVPARCFFTLRCEGKLVKASSVPPRTPRAPVPVRVSA